MALSALIWDPEVEGADDFGDALVVAGDVNGDGLSDLAIADTHHPGEGPEVGVVYVFYGQPTGFSDAQYARLAHPEPDVSDRHGTLLAQAGDVNGDGFDDLLVSTPGDDDVGHNLGAIWLYFGGEAGISTSGAQKLVPNPTGREERYSSVAGGGDVNGDGYADVFIGLPRFDAPDDAADEFGDVAFMGAGRLLYGSSTGLHEADMLELISPEEEPGKLFGVSAAMLDLDGDGFDELLVGATEARVPGEQGQVHIYPGGVDGLDVSGAQRLTPRVGISRYGWPLAPAGDLDRDGFEDFIVGAPYTEGPLSNPRFDAAGVAVVHYGSSSGVDLSRVSVLEAPPHDEDEYLGWSVTGGGDLNGDGYDDVLIGQKGYGDVETSSGAARVWFGGPGGLDEDTSLRLEAEVPTPLGELGRGVAIIPDLDGDGLAEVAVASGQLPEGWDDGVYFAAGADLEPAPCERRAWYVDDDGDGYGATGSLIEDCEQPAGAVEFGGDCADDDASVHPEAADDCGDGVDADCDGAGGPDDDEDGDGLSWAEEQALGTEPCDADTDQDGLLDGEDPAPLSAELYDSGALDDSGRSGDKSGGCLVAGEASGGAWFSLMVLLCRRRSRLSSAPAPAA